MSSLRSDRSRVAGDAAFLAAFLLAAWLWSGHPWLMLAIETAILVARFALIGVRRDWVYLAMGIVLGGGNDLMSMMRGVYAYNVPHPGVPWPIPLWMFLFWGQAFLVMRSLFSWGPFKGPGATRPLWPPGWALLVDLAALVLMKMVFYRYSDVRYVPELLAAAIVAATYVMHGITRTDIRIMLVTLAVAPLVEGALIAAGIYDYTNGVILGMPAWLLVFWLFATPLLKRIMDRMEFRERPRARGLGPKDSEYAPTSK